MLSLSTIHLIVDFGLVVLIWLVQWIIYPSFLQMRTQGFAEWHRGYVKRISVLVFPLMSAQLGMAVYRTIVDPAVLWLVYIALVLVIWFLTFGRAVALHNHIGRAPDDNDAKWALIRLNLPRAILWTLCFIMNMAFFVL